MNKVQGMLVICDSCDASGKTKLAQHLIEKYRFDYFHNGLYKDVKAAHTDCLAAAQTMINKYDKNIYIDRLHLSEFVYGTIFRNKAQYDYKQMEEQIKQDFKKYTLIICVPPKDLVVKKHTERLAEGDEEFDTVERVYDMYKELSEDKSLKAYIYDYSTDPNYEKLDKYLEEKCKE